MVGLVVESPPIPNHYKKPSFLCILLLSIWRKREDGGISRLRARCEPLFSLILAEAAGFEPVRPLRAYTLSKRAP